MTKTLLSRRRALRGLFGGAAVSIALPALEPMLNNHGTAQASGRAFPRRFGVWFWGGGVQNATFYPTRQGPGFLSTSEQLAPLAPFESYVSLARDMEHKFKGKAHNVNRAAVLSGSYEVAVNDLVARATYGGAVLPSLDQVVAEAWRGKTSLPSLEVGISRKGAHVNSTSFKGTKRRVPSEGDPQVVFDRLFLGGMPRGGGADRSKSALLAAHRSVLDATIQDARDLSRVVGAADKRRLDSHLDAIRFAERRIQSANRLACAVPGRPPEKAWGDGSAREDLEGKHKVMADLITLSLACDITRVFSVEFTGAQCHTVFWQVGVHTEHHPMTHGEQGGKRDDILKTVTFTMQQLAYLLKRLSETREGDASLLDRLSLYATTESFDANIHDLIPPILLIGKAGGALRGGVYHEAKDKENASRAMFTSLRAAGLPLQAFGHKAGRTTEVMSQMMT